MEAKPGSGSSLTDLAVTVLGAAAAGVSGLAFVAAVGGIVTQARFRGAGLPTEQSVAVETRGVLLAVGGEVLAIAIVAALALVAMVHWLRAAPKEHAETSGATAGQPRVGWPVLREGRWAIFFFVLALALIADYFFFWAGHELDSYEQFRIGLLVVITTLIGAAAATVLANHACRARDAGDDRGEGLRLLGLFIVVTFLGGIVAAAGSLANPMVRPAAMLLRGPREVSCGLYVGQTADRIYLGQALPKSNPDLGQHSKGVVVEIRRDRISRLVIGSSQPLKSALNRAAELVDGALHAGKVDVTHCEPPPATVR
jgi:hypothetical protein